MIASIFISSMLMWGAQWAIARREGCPRLLPFLLVNVAVCVLNYLALRFLGPWGLPLTLGALVLAVRQWCALSLAQGLLAALAWLLGQFLSGRWFGTIY